jgi:hypothetical protein
MVWWLYDSADRSVEAIEKKASWSGLGIEIDNVEDLLQRPDRSHAGRRIGQHDVGRVRVTDLLVEFAAGIQRVARARARS